MKILACCDVEKYDFSIIGLGYESRAAHLFDEKSEILGLCASLGYEEHTDKFGYQNLKSRYIRNGVKVIEGSDTSVINDVMIWVKNNLVGDKPVNFMLDITVLSRPRLSAIIYKLLKILPDQSKLTINYEVSSFVDAPEGFSPIKKVGELMPELAGDIGDLNYPTSIIIGLGYEKGKALGLVNLIDAEYNFLCIPVGLDQRFDGALLKNNSQLIDLVPRNQIVKYRVDSPFNTYLDIRDLVISVMSFSNPMLVPLGPKIFAAICVVIAQEIDRGIPVWRVSSEHSETPIDRKASGTSLSFTIEI